MKSWLTTLFLLLAVSGGCKKATFKSVDKSADLAKIGTGSGDGAGEGDVTPNNQDLIVTVPVSEIPAGGKVTQATAKMKDGSVPAVTWTVKTEPGKDPGTIGSDGVYTSPKTGTETYPVVITATVTNDPKIHNSVPLVITPGPDATGPNTNPNPNANGLIVTLPISQISVGGNKTTAVATLKDGTKNPPVSWVLSGPAGKDLGTLDPVTGVYTSPLTGTEQVPVVMTAILKADPTIKGMVSLIVIPASKGGTKPELMVSVPVSELKVGGNKTTAVAALKDGTKNPPVIWTVSTSGGKDPGTIDAATGVYTSPLTGSETYSVLITATLIADNTIKGSTALMIIPLSTGKPELIVSVPVTEIAVGGGKTTATAVLKDGTKNPPVTWVVTGPAGKNIGTIDPNTGVYTSPATGSDQFAVIITGTLVSDPTVKASTPLIIIPTAKPMLIVTIASPQIKVGGNQVTATATLSNGTKNPPVTWTVMAPAGKEAGTIDGNGVYTSPKTGNVKYPVIITAVLIADKSVMSSVPLDIIPDDTIFARCKKANVVFPIVADVYELPANSEDLPTDWLSQKYATTVCMDQYNVPEREFTSGFPDVPGLFEWFGMNTRTSIIVPADGDYQIRLISDDGSKLWIDDTLVINNDGQHQTVAIERTARMKKGVHKLTLDYFQGPRFKISLVLEWKKPGDANFTVVPKAAFQ